MEITVLEKEEEVKDLIQRAKASPDKKGPLRRDMLIRLIDLTHSSHPRLKILAAENLRFFLTDFPQLEEAAINAIYDLCEDPSQKVRIQGYPVITQASKANNNWVKRNADVLLQLLQSDSPEEVVVVKKALTEHLDLDAKVTLSVLCDQIVAPEESSDDEEQAMRIRLRSLVLSFLTGEARKVIIERHALRGSGAEEVLLKSLLSAIPKLGFSDVEAIVKELLLPLNAFRPGSRHGVLLMEAILCKASWHLRAGTRSSDNIELQFVQSYLNLMNFVIVTKKAAPATQLLRFYCQNIATKITMQKFSREQQCLITCGIAETLSCTDAGDPDIDMLRRQVVDSCPFLLETLSLNTASTPRVVKASLLLLQGCVHRKEDSHWLPPPNLLSALSVIDNAIKNTGNIHNLIRSLVPTVSAHSEDSISSASIHLSSNNSVRTKPGSELTSAPSSRVASKPSGSLSVSSSKHSLNLDPLRPLKRLKEDLRGEPSLLKRLSSNFSPQLDASNVTRAIATVQPEPELSGQIIGYSQIQARRIAQPVNSLLDRLDGTTSTSGRTSTRKRGRS